MTGIPKRLWRADPVFVIERNGLFFLPDRKENKYWGNRPKLYKRLGDVKLALIENRLTDVVVKEYALVQTRTYRMTTQPKPNGAYMELEVKDLTDVR